MHGKIGEYIDKHFGRFLAMMIVVLLVGIFGGMIAVDAVNKQTRRWDSWMWAHQMEFVPGLKWNSNQCVGEWVWKHY